MPPQVALLIACLFIVFLYRRDSLIEKRETDPIPSSAVWIPTIWLLILGSRSVSQWLNLRTSMEVGQQLLEGSPLDLAVYGILIVAACVVLSKREIPWGDVFRRNPWLVLFFIFCGVSVLWSDFPFVSFRRWVKGLGDPMMALVLLSDPAPGKAIEKVIKRCAYVLIPLSIIFIKYFPAIGRGYSGWTGAAFYTGVTTNKNLLGYLLFAFGLYFVSALFGRGAKQRFAGKRGDLIISVLFLLMTFWLFKMSDSKTPLIAMVVGAIVVLGMRVRFMRAHLFAVILTCAVVQILFPISDMVIASVGRNSTLTGRTDVWDSVLRLRVNDLVGAGFESFWLGDRLKLLWAEFDFRPTQAHNGYLETFLNLGAIGLCLLVGVLCSAFFRVRRKLVSYADSDAGGTRDELVFAIFGMGYFLAYLLYNVTEATFQALNFLFIVFLFLIIDYPKSNTSHRVFWSRSIRKNVVPRKKQIERESVHA